MQTITDDYSAVPAIERRLADLIRRLADKGCTARAEARRQQRRVRIMAGPLYADLG